MGKAAKRKSSARQLAIAAARAAHDRRLTGIVVLDLRGISPVTDFFVICTGTSAVQMRAVAREIADASSEGGHTALNVAGVDPARWILLDFVDVVVHMFDDEQRRYYELELMWGDAPRVRWRRRQTATPERDTSQGDTSQGDKSESVGDRNDER